MGLTGASMLVMLATATSQAGAVQTGRRPCARHGSLVLSSNPHAQVFRYRSGVYACLRRQGKVTRLGYAPESQAAERCTQPPTLGCAAVWLETLVGTVVAYAEKPLGYTAHVVARSVATGQVLHDVPVYVEWTRFRGQWWALVARSPLSL